MARSREPIWLGLLGGFVTVGGVLLGVSAALGAAAKGYSVWTSAPAIIAYIFFVLAAASLACALFDVPIPLRKGRRNVEPPAEGFPADENSGPRPYPASAVEPTPARLEVVRQTGGWFEDQNAIQWLTLPDLSRELWGDSKGGPFDFLRNRRKIAGQLARNNQEARDHLAAALRLVPDYSGISYPYGLPQRSAVGVLTATIQLLVKVRNLGIESGGITLMSSTETVLRPPALQPLDAWVTYSVTADETRHLVAPGVPVDVPATVWMGCARTRLSEFPLDSSDAITIARVSRAFADFLCGPIEGIEVDAFLDGGERVRTTLEINIRAAADRCAVNELEVDELEHHARALDEAIDRQVRDQARQSQDGDPERP